MKLNRKNLLLAAAISLTLAAPSLHAQSGNWNVNVAGNWSLNTNWNPAVVPGSAAGDVIGLINDITAARIVTIDATSVTAGVLNIGDSNNTHAFTLAASGGAILTLDNTASTDAQINMTGGIATTISAPITLADNLVVNSTNYLLVSGGVGESGIKTLTKTGAGTLSLSGTSSYTGGSTVSAGALSFRTTLAVALTGTHAFGASATLGLGVGAGGFLIADVNNALLGTVPALGTITLDPATKIGVDTGAGNFNFNTALATSSRGLVKLGGSTLTLSTDNSVFDGDITVDAGALAITNSNSLGSAIGKTTINGGNAGTGNSLSFGGVASDLTIAEKINFAGNPNGRSLLANVSNFNHTLTGAMDVSSDTNIAQWSSGGDAVTGSVTFTGDITGTFSGAGNGLLIRGNAHLTPALNPTNKIESNITLTGGGVTKTDSGTWRIGASGKTYTAPALGVANGILQMGVTNYLAAGVAVTMGNATGGSTGTLDLNGFSQTVASIFYNGAGVATGTRSITNSDLVNAAILTVDNATDNPSLGTSVTTNNVVLTGNLGVTKTGSGKLVLPGTNTYSGATLISNGSLEIGTGTSTTTGSLTATTSITNDGNLSINRSNAFSQATGLGAGVAITGSGSFTQVGTGTTTLTNATNSYTGDTTISAGTLSVELTGHLGGPSADLVFNGGTLQITGTTLDKFSTIGHPVSFTATKTVGIDINNAAHTFTADQVLNQTTGGLTKSGAGKLVLDQANTYSGNTIVTTATGGTLRLENASALGSSSSVAIGANSLEIATTPVPSPAIIMQAGTIVSDRASSGAGITHVLGTASLGNGINNFTAGSNVTIGTAAIQLGDVTNNNGNVANPQLNPTTANLIITGSVTLGVTNTGTCNLTLGGTGSVNSIAGAIVNGTRATGNLIKSGTSAWTLNGVNIYTGNTTVNDGTLTLSNAASTANANPGNDASTVTIATTGAPVLNLTYTGTDVVKKLVIGAADQLPGVYGKIGSTSPIIGIIQITGDGTLTVGHDYAFWASEQDPVVTGGPNGDSNNNGVPNLVEYALPNGQTNGTLTGATLSYAKRGLPWGTDLIYDIESTTTLAAGDWFTIPKPPVVDDAGSISITLTFNLPKDFARLKVTQNP